MKFIVLSALLIVLCACSGDISRPVVEQTETTWNGDVVSYGALRSIFQDGETGAVVVLDSVLRVPHTFAVGALADLEGEITVMDGRVFLAYSESEHVRVDTSLQAGIAATLLAVSVVPRWQEVVTTRPIRFDDIEAEIAQLAEAAGMDIEARFPFVVEGRMKDLEWHVIDGKNLTDGSGSREDHLDAGLKIRRDSTTATLVGFFSAMDAGVFTHMGSRTHIHTVVDNPLSTGHVDHVTIPPGARIRFPSLADDS